MKTAYGRFSFACAVFMLRSPQRERQMHTFNRVLITIAAGLALTIGAGPAAAKGGSHGIKGHVTKKGTYVAPTRATNPNKTKNDNYSSKGNTNPANGKQGTKNADASNQ